VLHPSNQTLECGKWSCWEWNIAISGGPCFRLFASGSAIDCRATAAGEQGKAAIYAWGTLQARDVDAPQGGSQTGKGKLMEAAQICRTRFSTMNTYPPPGSGAGRRFEEVIERIETEVKNAVDYMNDRVVPHVRRDSIAAMRRMAETLGKLADRMERAPEPGSETESKDQRP
jgi:hypothetical protein